MFDYSPETQEKITIAIISVLGSGIISFLIGHYLGKRNIRYQNFLRASAEFRNVFTDILIFLDKSRDEGIIIDKLLLGTDSVYDFIVKNIDAQKKAYMNFSQHLWWFKRYRFRKAWENYENPKHNDYQGTFDWLSRISVYRAKKFSKEKEVRELVRKKTNKLLSFAKAR